MNWPIRTMLTRKKVFRKYFSHGAPFQAVWKFFRVHGLRRLKFTASEVEWKAAQKAKTSGEIHSSASSTAPAESSVFVSVLTGNASSGPAPGTGTPPRCTARQAPGLSSLPQRANQRRQKQFPTRSTE